MGVLAGIENMEEAIKKMADGGPEGITMHKGRARQYFLPQAARVYLAIKSTIFSPYHPNRWGQAQVIKYFYQYGKLPNRSMQGTR